MNITALILCSAGVFLGATPVWYFLLMEILFRCGIGYRRRDGVLRRITMLEWLNVTGAGIFLGSILFGLGRSYVQHP